MQQLADGLELSDDERAGLARAARGGAGSAGSPHTPNVLTFLIADVRGYTHFTLEQGDEAAARLATTFAAIAREVAAARDGEVLELRGDEALAVFASARQALRAALDLQARFAEEMAADSSYPLHVGIGLDAGEAVPVEEGYRGGALNLAARLCSLAAAGEVFCSQTVVDLARKTEGIAFMDRGEVILKGLSNPVRVVQIGPEGDLPEDLPPLQPVLVTHPNNLPDAPTPFIGREREIEQIVGLLQDPHIRLVTLTGTGGTGKTRLALQVGAALLHDFRDGVFFVNLASLADPLLVSSGIAEVLGVKEQAGKDLLQSLIGHLKDRHVLLVLDNFEHLLDAASVVASLLDRCRELHVLVTSRIPLHLSREHEHPVPPLSVPDPRHLPDAESLTQYEAVALFIERAKAATDSFAVTNENAPAVAEICYRLDGLPLAIELAAARVKLFPPQALLQRLSSRLTLLTGGARDRPARQQTLRGAIDWSYSLLTEEEQAFFVRFAVFAGGCSLDAAEAVCNPDKELDLFAGLANLVDKSLLRQDSSRVPALAGDSRFLMLETIREYAIERLEETGSFEQLTSAHARYFLALAEEAASALEGPQQIVWLERLEIERDNLRAALQWARDRGMVDLGMRLARGLQGFWMVRGPLSEGRRWLEELASAGGGTPAPQAAALFAAARLAGAEGRYREAGELVERSLVLYRELGDQRGSAEAVGWLAFSWYVTGEVDRARDLMRQSEREGRETGDLKLLAASLHLQAVAGEQEDPKRVQSIAEESLALYRKLEDPEGIADVLRILAAAAYAAGDRQKARELIDELLDLRRRLPAGSQQEEWLEPLAYRARMQGDYTYARRILEQLMTRGEVVGDRRIAAHARAGLGLLAREQGDYARAAAQYEESAAVLQEVGDLLGRCRALVGLSDVARDQGDAERVITLCEESLATLQDIGDTFLTGAALHNLGLAAWYQGDHTRATRLFDESVSFFQKQKDVVNAGEALGSVGLLALDEGRYDRARELFSECLVIARNMQSRLFMPTLLEGMAGVAAGTGQAERAARLFGTAEAERLAMGIPRRPAQSRLYDRYVAAARTALGAEPYLQWVEQGRAMTLEDAVSFALEEPTD